MTFYEKPSFIPDSIVGAPLDFPWQGAQAHIGPVESVTPLLKRLGRCTGLAEVAMCAGVLLWATWRLKHAAAVDHNLELAEAAFAYGVDWRYVDPEAGPDGAPPDQPAAESAAIKIAGFMQQALDHEQYWHSFYLPVSETFHSAHIVSHMLPGAVLPEFEAWLISLADRMAIHFPLPDIPYRKSRTFESKEAYREYVSPRRGIAVPPHLLDPNFDYRPADREALIAEFVATLNPKTNRFLRSAKSMAKLGFKGVPYPSN